MKLDWIDYLIIFVFSTFVSLAIIVPWTIGVYSILKFFYEAIM
jgi:hypothetical protein